MGLLLAGLNSACPNLEVKDNVELLLFPYLTLPGKSEDDCQKED